MHKISPKLTLTETEHSYPTFTGHFFAYGDLHSKLIEFCCKRLTGLELIKDIVETII